MREYSPTDALILPTVFNEWSTLHQHKTETAWAFAGRVRTLAQQSRQCGQTYTEPSIILTFLCGLNSNFEGFVCDYHTGHNDVTTAKLANVVQTASSLEKNHNSKQGTLAKQATKSTDGKPLGSTSAKTPSSCIGYEAFKPSQRSTNVPFTERDTIISSANVRAYYSNSTSVASK
jgi:hypothetical protein